MCLAISDWHHGTIMGLNLLVSFEPCNQRFLGKFCPNWWSFPWLSAAMMLGHLVPLQQLEVPAASAASPVSVTRLGLRCSPPHIHPRIFGKAAPIESVTSRVFSTLSWKLAMRFSLPPHQETNASKLHPFSPTTSPTIPPLMVTGSPPVCPSSFSWDPNIPTFGRASEGKRPWAMAQLPPMQLLTRQQPIRNKHHCNDHGVPKHQSVYLFLAPIRQELSTSLTKLKCRDSIYS